jgi:CDP-diacylglycerol---glycerol-3-phosphate 3-phosphatidyltransferase
MTLRDFSPVLDAVLRPWGEHLARRGITAGMVTVAGTLLCLATGALVALGRGRWFLLLLAFFALLAWAAACRLRALLAQEYGQGSVLATLLHEVGVPVSETALFWPLAAVPGHAAWEVTLCCLLALLTEFAGSVAGSIGAARRDDGPMDATTRGVALAVLLLLLGLGFGPGWWTWVWFQVLPFLLGWTICRRLRGALSEVRPSETDPATGGES